MFLAAALFALPLYAQPSPNAPIPIPPPPDVNDPMLAPMPPAARSISTWDEARALVRARSTDLRIAQLEIDRAEAQSRIALGALLPTINGTVVGTHNFITKDTPSAALAGFPTTSPTENFATGNLSMVQPLVNVRAIHSWRTTIDAQRVQTLSLEDVQRNIALKVANALVGVVTAERVAELNRVGFRNALERLDLARRKRLLGAATGLDVVRAQQDVESARATLVTGDESLRRAREALGLALGLPEQVGVARNLNIDGLEREALAQCKQVPTLDARADIAAQHERVHVAGRNIDNVWTQFLPVLNAQSSVNTSTVASGNSPATTWNIQAVLSVPFWEGGARYGSLRDARAQEREAQANLEALKRSATVELDQVRRNVRVAEDSRKVAADERALAAETDRLVRTGYIEGQGTSLELVTAAAALRQAEINLALKEFDVVRARVLAILSMARCPF